MPSKSVLPHTDARQIAKWFQGLADMTRLRILDQLDRAQKELPAWDFALELFLTESQINYHLRRLCAAELILSRQDGKRRVYRLAGP
jgi:DNA-binding transcriptional ArsR family regulator